jgi:hypothetical protein
MKWNVLKDDAFLGVVVADDEEEAKRQANLTDDFKGWTSVEKRDDAELSQHRPGAI